MSNDFLGAWPQCSNRFCENHSIQHWIEIHRRIFHLCWFQSLSWRERKPSDSKRWVSIPVQWWMLSEKYLRWIEYWNMWKNRQCLCWIQIPNKTEPRIACSHIFPPYTCSCAWLHTHSLQSETNVTNITVKNIDSISGVIQMCTQLTCSIFTYCKNGSELTAPIIGRISNLYTCCQKLLRSMTRELFIAAM